VKQYSKNSKVRKVNILRSSKREFFCAEIIKEPNGTVPKKQHDALLKEVHDLAKKGWGEFDNEYLEKSVLESYLLCLLRDSKGILIGMAPLKRLRIFNRTVYSFGLSVVHPDYRGFSLLTKMSAILVRQIFIENFFRGKIGLELVFITPNIRTMGAIARIASFIYPNPYEYDLTTQMIPPADEETWKTVNEFLRITDEKYRKLDRNGCVMEGFYDDKKHLIVKNGGHIDKKLNAFGKKYLYSVPGSELVVRAKIDLLGLIKNV